MPKSEPSAKLKELLGPDALAKSPNAAVFQAALDKVKEAKAKKLEEIAMAKISEAIEIQEEIDKLISQHNGCLAKAKKRLGKVLSAIERMAEGKPPEDGKGGEEGGKGDEPAEEPANEGNHEN